MSDALSKLGGLCGFGESYKMEGKKEKEKGKALKKVHSIGDGKHGGLS